MNPISSLDEKQKNLVIGGIIAVIIAIDVVFLLTPQVKILSRLSVKTSALSTDLKNTRRDIVSQAEFENKLKILKARIKDFGATVTPEEELHNVLESVSKTANLTFVKITQVKPIKEEKTVILKAEGATYYKIPILIDAQCGYHALGRFLNELENGQTYMKVIGLEIMANPANQTRHLVRLTVQTFVVGK